MKKFSRLVFVLIIASLMLAACGSEPTPLVDWPLVCGINGGKCYEVVYQLGGGSNIQGAMPNPAVNYEMVEVKAMSEAETLTNISSFGIGPNEQVYVLILPSTWANENGQDISSAAVAAMPANPKVCAALCIHLIERVIGDGLTWTAVTAMINAVSDGTVVPTVMKMNTDGQVAVQFISYGVKWLVLFGGKNPPTAIGPVVGNTLGRITGSFKSTLVVGQGKAISTFAELVALMKCVKSNWPQTPDDVEKARQAHNSLYSARKVEKVPASFPVPFPKKILTGATGNTYVTVKTGNFTGMENVTLNSLIGMGIIIIVADGVPFDDPLAVSFTLKWANQGFSFAH